MGLRWRGPSITQDWKKRADPPSPLFPPGEFRVGLPHRWPGFPSLPWPLCLPGEGGAGRDRLGKHAMVTPTPSRPDSLAPRDLKELEVKALVKILS